MAPARLDTHRCTTRTCFPCYAAPVLDCRVLDAIALIPVVQVEPKGDGMPLPNGSATEDPAGWDAYWRACLSHRGFPDLEPIEKGSWLVPVTSLSDPALRAVLHEHLDAARSIPITQPDNLGSFNGGFVLSAAGEHLIRPNCCCDLSNLDDWVEASQYREPEWAMLWVGHPWVSVRFEASQLWISDYHEGEPTGVICRFEPAALEQATTKARNALEQLALRLEPHVASHVSGVSQVRQICRWFAGLGSA